MRRTRKCLKYLLRSFAHDAFLKPGRLKPPNAGAHLLPEAAAKRRLEAVRCSALFGPAWSQPSHLRECRELPFDVGAGWLVDDLGHACPLGLSQLRLPG